MSGNLEIVKFLIDEQGFDPQIKSQASKSQPIHVATNAGNVQIVDYLVREKGCDPKEEDRNFENCLTLAIKNRKREMASYLIKTGQFKLDQVIRRRGFNYFAYALVKGQ